MFQVSALPLFLPVTSTLVLANGPGTSSVRAHLFLSLPGYIDDDWLQPPEASLANCDRGSRYGRLAKMTWHDELCLDFELARPHLSAAEPPKTGGAGTWSV
ncbi:hypothetical protein B0T24DRAFT_725550 [Lasiosphaeria ovina]|uniref:Secreted protein n=1 Tax=Lasiosphaeria ovina TaxID=92902 RepID=A0AAE0JS03_9PEZI|nr:hypothetical protein B0T24DRAFT_725550 [Lasiosphaeria ovina]